MDFELTEEQQDIRKAAREFAEGEFPEIARECDEKEEFPFDLWKKACKLGFVGAFIKEEYGGQGLGFLEHAIITEEFWRVDGGLGQCLISTPFGAEMIQEFGNEDQKKKYLTPLVRGEMIMGSAITEPDAGSDISSVSTRAERAGNDYVINGSKIFTTNGCIAHFLNVFCLTNPAAKSRHERHSVIIVETNRDGFEATKIRGKLGIRASDTAELSFENVRVPGENLVGEEGRGFYQFMDFFNRTRLMVSATGVGLAQGAMEKAITHVKQRVQFGKPLASFQITQFKIAEMATKIEAARLLYRRAAWLVDQGKMDPKLIAMAKWFAGEVGVRVTDEVLQLHGGYGYIADYEVERFYRDSKSAEILEGTKEIEKIIVAREILGRF